MTYIYQQCCGYEIMSCVVIAIQNVLLKSGVEDIFMWYNSLRELWFAAYIKSHGLISLLTLGR